MREYSLEELTDLFGRLGARKPKMWAESHIDGRVNQLLRFLFLRQAWTTVVDENDHSWIQREIDESKRDAMAPGAMIGPALERLLELGASPQDITDVARVMQYNTLYHLCYYINHASIPEPELKDIDWGLFQIQVDYDADDDEIEILDAIQLLHQSVLSTDPTRREMRPRGYIPED